ncbi:MAG: T9SS type A sorting domain-containing protein, partial [Elusimicrobiota bacterium]
YAIEAMLNPYTTYYWKVYAYDTTGGTTTSTQTDWQFVVSSNTTPGSFNMLYSSGTVHTRLPYFGWDQSLETDPGDYVRYELKYSTNAEFGTYVSSAGLNTQTYNVTSKLMCYSTYYWTVNAYDKYRDTTTAIQNVWYMFIDSNTVPVSFNINHSSAVITTHFPTLSWYTTTDPDGDNIEYEIHNSTYQDFSVYTTTRGIVTTQYTFSNGLAPYATHYWRIVAYDIYGGSVTSAQTGLFYITTNTVPTDFIVIPTSSSVDTRTPTFDWHASTDTDGDTVYYEIRVSTSQDMSAYVSSSGLTTTGFTLPPGLPPYTTYYWEVLAYDNYDGSSTVSDLYSFYIATNAAPVSFDIVATTSSVASTTTVTFDWQQTTDPDQDTVYYTVIYSTTPGFEVCDTSSNITSTELNLQDTLTPQVTYYWKVIAYDTYGGTVTSQQTGSVFINVTVSPPVPLYNFYGIAASTTIINWYWEDSYDNENGYILFSVTGDTIAYISSNTTWYTETNLSSNTAYSRYMLVYNLIGLSTGYFVRTVYTQTLPITELSISTRSAHTVNIEIPQYSSGTVYAIMQSTDNVNWTVTSGTVTVKDYAVEQLLSDTTYYFRVYTYTQDLVLVDTGTAVTIKTSKVDNEIFNPVSTSKLIVMQYDTQSIIKEIRVYIPQNAVTTEVYVDVNPTPLITPKKVGKQQIEEANTKLSGKDNVKVFDTGITELNMYRTNGTRITSGFAQNIGVSIVYNDNNNDGKIDGVFPPVYEETLRIYRLDEYFNEWVLIGGVVDKENNTIQVELNQFSVYAMFGKLISADNLNSLKVYPNPYKPYSNDKYSRVNGIVFEGLTNNSKIRIYNILGELVFEASETNGDNVYEWNTKDISGNEAVSGVYLYVVTNNNDSSTVMKGKLSIIK